MGTRIVKVVGYGLTGLSIDPENYMQTNDPRLNQLAAPLSYDDPEEKNSDASYIEHLRSKASELDPEKLVSSEDFGLIFPLRELEKNLDGQDPSESFTILEHIVYDGEYGDPGTILIIPPGMKDSWYRYGDHIDGLESSLEDEGSIEPKIKVMDFSPYPFDGMMDARTGEKISYKADQKIRTVRELEKALKNPGLKKKSQKEFQHGIKLLQADVVKDFNFEDYTELLKNIVPLVPVEVKELVQWAELFTGPEVWKDLRPMVYTYWS